MPATSKSLRTCRAGHRYYKSSDCPTCPVCEQERKPENGFLALLSAPARRKQVYMCGPAPMLKAFKKELRRQGTRMDAIHHKEFAFR